MANYEFPVVLVHHQVAMTCRHLVINYVSSVLFWPWPTRSAQWLVSRESREFCGVAVLTPHLDVDGGADCLKADTAGDGSASRPLWAILAARLRVFAFGFEQIRPCVPASGRGYTDPANQCFRHVGCTSNSTICVFCYCCFTPLKWIM
jgi:hypothetical protein